MDFNDDEFAMEFMKNLEKIEKNKDDLQESDVRIHEIVQKMSVKQVEEIPEPTNYVISTRSAMCQMSESTISLHLGKLITFFARKIFDNFFDKTKKYPIQGIKTHNLEIRYDEGFIKKYRRPYIKYDKKLINPTVKADCDELLETLIQAELAIYQKQGRQKNKDENDHFYNCCSVYVKAGKNYKIVNVKLFNNGKITLTGSKEEIDGVKSCMVFLEEMKRCKDIFINMAQEKIDELNIQKFETTMINSDFNLRFKLDLNILLTCIHTHEQDVFVKKPEKYRGLIIGYFYNKSKGEHQDGKCNCETRCKGKGLGDGPGDCKKVTIAVFKTGKTIITGGRSTEQIDLAYKFFNDMVRRYYSQIMKVSIIDLIEEEEQMRNDMDFDTFDQFIEEEEKKIEEVKKIKKKVKKIPKEKKSEEEEVVVEKPVRYKKISPSILQIKKEETLIQLEEELTPLEG